MNESDSDSGPSSPQEDGKTPGGDRKPAAFRFRRAIRRRHSLVHRGLGWLRILLNRFVPPGIGRATLYSPLVGVGAGLGAVVFLVALMWTSQVVLSGLTGLVLPPTAEEEARLPSMYDPDRWWLVILVPTVGGLISGLIVFRYAPEAEGHGTDALIRAFHRGAGQIRARVPLVKSIASVITIGSGGSAGQEGPIAQIGAGLGSILARWLKLTPNERRLLMLSGAAGGVGAIFRAPLGGALFATEVLYMSTATESAALLPCLISSILAYSTFALFITPEPIFLVPHLEFHGLAELPLFAALGVLCTVIGFLYVKVFYGGRDHIFRHLPIPRALKPAIGGALIGLMALFAPQVMMGGYGWVQWGAIGMPPQLVPGGASGFSAPEMGVGLLLGLALLKILATTLTISSGGSGGVFGPSVFIGGMIGGAFGQVVDGLFPAMNLEPAAFALVGMGGFFAGVSKTPLTSTLIVCEMAGSYSLLVPLMLVCAIHMILSQRWTLYEEQVRAPIDSPAHQGDFVVDVLERLKVSELAIRTRGLELIPEATPLDDILKRVANSTETLFPVVDAKGRLSGIFTLRNVRMALLGAHAGPLVLADDIATRPVQVVTPEDDLHTALRRLTELNADEIPVVSPDDHKHLIGLLSRRELVLAYTNQVRHLRNADGLELPGWMDRA